MSAPTSGASPGSQPAGPLPNQPDAWTLQQRHDAALKEIEIEGEYDSQTLTQASNVIHNFKAICERRKVHYADAFLRGDMTAEEFKKVDGAKLVLKTFWSKVRKLYNLCKVTADGGDFFAPGKKWLRRGDAYRILLEPLSIAGWYKHGNHLTSSGHYIDQAAEPEGVTKRPSRYVFVERLQKAYGRGHVYSLDKAEQYKREAQNGNLYIQSIGNARADPPQGFKRLSIDPQPSLRSTLDQPSPTGSPTPTESVPGGVAPTLSTEARERIPPGWKRGVKYAVVQNDLVAPTYPLPKPPQSYLPKGVRWESAQSPHCRVTYNAIVYETERSKYLVVRARLYAGVSMTHDFAKHRGYFRERLGFSMQAPGRQESPGTHPIPEQLASILRKRQEKTVVGGSWGGSVALKNAFTLPTLEVAGTVGSNRNRENGQEYTTSDEFVEGRLNLPVEGRFTWDWRMLLLKDSQPYMERSPTSGARALPDPTAFAVTVFAPEVQGTWALNASDGSPVDLRFSIEQKLVYDAVFESSWCLGGGAHIKSWPTSEHAAQKIVDLDPVSVPTAIPEEALIASSDELPPWLN